MYLLHGDRVAFRHQDARHVADGNLGRRRPAAQVPALDRQPGAALHRTVQGEDLPERRRKRKARCENSVVGFDKQDVRRSRGAGGAALEVVIQTAET